MSLLVTSLVSPSQARLVIATQGEARAVVVVAPEATEPEKHAARELSDLLKIVSGAELPILNEYDPARPCLLVGPQAAMWGDPRFSTEGLGQEGIVLRTVGKDLILAGGRPRGTLYAVFTFLEDVLGCRWWSPQASTVPHKGTIEVGTLSIRHVPPLEYREPYWGHTAGADWCVRNKLNGPRTELDAKRGGKYAEVGGVHSFYQYLPPDRYFKDHPEWYSEIKGQRTATNAQLCLTNPDMIREFTRNVIADVRAHTPDVTNVWVSQNDWDGCCQCNECRKVSDQEGSLSALVVHFVNAVAQEVGKQFPHVAVNTLAYDWSQKPPRNLRPLPNVVIWLCTTGCSYSQPYTHSRNRTFRECLDGWARVCDRIYIWDYVTNFSAYLCPHPNLRTLGPNMKYFADHHVKGVFSLGAYSAPGAELAELRAWVLAKLMWDPARNPGRLIDEFLKGYYGPAGPHLKKSLDLFHDAIATTGEDLGMCEQPAGKRWLTVTTLCRAMTHLKKAKEAVAGDGELTKRVQVAELPVLYVFLLRWDELQEAAKVGGLKWPLDTDLRPVYERFRAVMNENGITRYSEQNERDAFPLVEERVAVGKVPPPPGCEALTRDRWIDLQNVGFNTRREGETPPLVKRLEKDPLASDGSAAWMPGNHETPVLLRQLWRIPLIAAAGHSGKKLRCRLSVRCEVTGKEGIAFRCGIEGKGEPLSVRIADIPGTGYHSYDLGVFDDLRGWIHLWVSPANNGANVKAVWFDRAWLTQED